MNRSEIIIFSILFCIFFYIFKKKNGIYQKQ